MRAVFIGFVFGFLVSCAPQARFIQGWHWVQDETGGVPCHMRGWAFIPDGEFWEGARSGLWAYVHTDRLAPKVGGLFECYVFARVTEAVAMMMLAPALPWGFASESLYEHERRHWRDGLVHP